MIKSRRGGGGGGVGHIRSGTWGPTDPYDISIPSGPCPACTYSTPPAGVKPWLSRRDGAAPAAGVERFVQARATGS